MLFTGGGDCAVSPSSSVNNSDHCLWLRNALSIQKQPISELRKANQFYRRYLKVARRSFMLIMSNGRYLIVQHQRKVCRCLFTDIWKRKGCTKLTYSVTSKNSCTAHFFTDNLINDSSMEPKKSAHLFWQSVLVEHLVATCPFAPSL